jgi:hypothetical protein
VSTVVPESTRSPAVATNGPTDQDAALTKPESEVSAEFTTLADDDMPLYSAAIRLTAEPFAPLKLIVTELIAEAFGR